MINEAALLTVRERRDEIDQATLEEAIDRVVAGPGSQEPRAHRGTSAG